MSFTKNPSAKAKFSLTETPSILAAVVASLSRIFAEPLVPNSPLVKSSIPTFFPKETSLAMVAAQPNSTSSGCAPIASMSNFIVKI